MRLDHFFAEQIEIGRCSAHREKVAHSWRLACAANSDEEGKQTQHVGTW